MSLHDDLLDQAESLARHEPGKPKQASLRRAVSTAYYALFHLLAREGSQFLVVNKELRTLFARAFEHSEMKRVSRAFASGSLPDSIRGFEPVPLDLQLVANAFVQLQEARHAADYDVGRASYSRKEALNLVERARCAFDAWTRTKGNAASQAYLSALLLAKKWDR